MKYGAMVLSLVATLAMTWNPVRGAVLLDVTFTGDNVVDSFYFGPAADTPSPVDLTSASNLDDWDAADTISLNVDQRGEHTLYFRVTQHPTVGFSYRNPAAFLADISLGNTILSSTSESWMWASGFDDNGAITDPAGASGWAPVTAWAANEGKKLLLVTDEKYNHVTDEWYVQGDDPVPGISESAQWIWGGDNFDVGDPVSEQWLKTTVNAVPEPATITIWSLMTIIGAGFAAWRRKKAE